MKDNKKLVLLDLDNTLICAEDLTASFDSGRIEKARQTFKTIRMQDYYDIFERPHLQPFLDYVFKHFKVGVWTASSKEYASFIVKNFITHPNDKHKKKRHIDLFLCSHHCNVSKKFFKGTPKDLHLISDKWQLEEFANILLIDDLEELATPQPNNVIVVKPFMYDRDDAYNDTELLQTKKQLRETLRRRV